MNDTYNNISNVIGIVNGTDKDADVIIVGGHRDAWILGGAADPNSGSSVIGAVVEALGRKLDSGWTPKRTIIFASWDAEEQGLVGSTEWVEEHAPWLRDRALAYINLDVAVSGPQLYYAAVPQFHEVMEKVLKQVPHPKGKSCFDHLAGPPRVLGSGSDYTALITQGIASLDFGFRNGPLDPVYHYHSNYDSYHWMLTYGDPDLDYHETAARILYGLVLEMADSPSIPFNLEQYPQSLREYLHTLTHLIESKGLEIMLEPLAYSIEDMERAILKNRNKISEYSVKMFERAFVQNEGLPNRPFYKHLIYSPGLATGYAAKTFPGITEAVEASDENMAQIFVFKTASAIRNATRCLTNPRHPMYIL